MPLSAAAGVVGEAGPWSGARQRPGRRKTTRLSFALDSRLPVCLSFCSSFCLSVCLPVCLSALKGTDGSRGSPLPAMGDHQPSDRGCTVCLSVWLAVCLLVLSLCRYNMYIYIYIYIISIYLSIYLPLSLSTYIYIYIYMYISIHIYNLREVSEPFARQGSRLLPWGLLLYHTILHYPIDPNI